MKVNIFLELIFLFILWPAAHSFLDSDSALLHSAEVGDVGGIKEALNRGAHLSTRF